MSDQPSLDPCPFCGSEPLRGHTHRSIHYVKCPNCREYRRFGKTREEADRNWNTRFDPMADRLADDEGMDALIERLKGHMQSEHKAIIRTYLGGDHD